MYVHCDVGLSRDFLSLNSFDCDLPLACGFLTALGATEAVIRQEAAAFKSSVTGMLRNNFLQGSLFWIFSF